MFPGPIGQQQAYRVVLDLAPGFRSRRVGEDMTSDSIRFVAGLAILLLIAPAMIYTGWRRYDTGTIPPDSVEHYRVVAYLNIINTLRGRPQVHSLTPRQIRWPVSGTLC